MVLDASLLNTQHYKVRIKGKVEQSREGAASSPTIWCIEEGAFASPSTMVANFTPYYIYIYIISMSYLQVMKLQLCGRIAYIFIVAVMTFQFPLWYRNSKINSYRAQHLIIWWHPMATSLIISLSLWLLPVGILESMGLETLASDNWQTERFYLW